MFSRAVTRNSMALKRVFTVFFISDMSCNKFFWQATKSERTFTRGLSKFDTASSADDSRALREDSWDVTDVVASLSGAAMIVASTGVHRNDWLPNGKRGTCIQSTIMAKCLPCSPLASSVHFSFLLFPQVPYILLCSG